MRNIHIQSIGYVFLSQYLHSSFLQLQVIKISEIENCVDLDSFRVHQSVSSQNNLISNKLTKNITSRRSILCNVLKSTDDWIWSSLKHYVQIIIFQRSWEECAFVQIFLCKTIIAVGEGQLIYLLHLCPFYYINLS